MQMVGRGTRLLRTYCFDVSLPVQTCRFPMGCKDFRFRYSKREKEHRHDQCCGGIGTTWVCSLHTYKISHGWPRVVSVMAIFSQLPTGTPVAKHFSTDPVSSDLKTPDGSEQNAGNPECNGRAVKWYIEFGFCRSDAWHPMIPNL
jgi:hypothetical protein